MRKRVEGAVRCVIVCALKRPLASAQAQGFQQVTTTLTVSPHKNATIINRLGRELTGTGDVTFYEADFKKRDGFKKSCELGKKLGFYRQNYCGCIYSKAHRNLTTS